VLHSGGGSLGKALRGVQGHGLGLLLSKVSMRNMENITIQNSSQNQNPEELFDHHAIDIISSNRESLNTNLQSTFQIFQRVTAFLIFL